MASFSSHGFSSMGNSYSSSSSSDNKILEELFLDLDRQRQCAFACAVVGANSFHMLNANELEEARMQVSKWTQV
jgi:hypothetical protein